MKIRWYKKEDLKQIEKLAAAKGILLPDTGVLMVAERDDGSIAGFVNLRTTYTIEPLVSDHPLVTHHLFNNVMEAAQNIGATFIRAMVKEESDLLKLAERIGFNKVFEDQAVIELNIDNNFKNNSKSIN
jgi:hypothetical protein